MKNILGLSLLIITLTTSCASFFEDEPLMTPEDIFEDFWVTYDENYAGFDDRGVNWDEVYDLYRPQVNPSTSDSELFTILCEMVKPLDDGHVYIIAPDQPIYYSNQVRRENIGDDLFNIDVIQSNYLTNVNDGEGFFYGKLDKTAYIHFEYTHENMLVLDEFLSDNENAENLIIDLRHNIGGNFNFALKAFGQLTDQTRLAFRSRTKDGPGENDYTEWYDWNLEPKSSFYNKEIIVLIDRYTISAGERAVFILESLPNVTILGEATNGAQSTFIGRELANGWYYSIATQQIEMFDGQSYEGPGSPPDISIQNTIQDISAGKDKVLEKALEHLNG